MHSRKKCLQTGFTLLEILLVLVVMAVVIGMSVPSASGFLKQQAIRDTCKTLQTLATTAHKEAVLNHKDHYIIFKTTGFALYSIDQPDTPLAEHSIEDSDLTYEIRLWPNTDSSAPNDTRWIFSALGLVYPLTITVKNGDAWESLEFDPLTGGVFEQKYQFP